MISQALVALEEAWPKITGTPRLDLQWPLVSGSEAPYPTLTPRQVKRAIKTLGGFGAPAATPSTVGTRRPGRPAKQVCPIQCAHGTTAQLPLGQLLPTSVAPKAQGIVEPPVSMAPSMTAG